MSDNGNVATTVPDRMLAQIVRVQAISPIKDADKIEVANVLGWEVVVRKDEFKVGDLAIYFSIGSILEKDNPNTSFLEGKPLLTKKLRGVVSQGLLGPLSWLEPYGVDKNSVKEDDDMTQALKVQKWVPKDELELYSPDSSKTPFPNYVPKTDEERIQNMSKQLPKFEGKNVIITQKFDGTSTTFVVLDKNFLICGRNNILKNETNATKHYFEIANKYNLEEQMKKLDRNLAIQGETIGPKINANRHKVTEIEFYVFNIYDIDARSYVSWNELLDVTSKLGLKTVEVVYCGLFKQEWLSVKELLKLADEQRYPTGQIAEGIVLKTDDGIGHTRISCKIISNNYLLKYKL